MKNDETILSQSIPDKESAMEFWKKAFLYYMLLEAFLICTQYFVTWSKCAACPLPVPFYIVSLIKQIVFTAVLWYCLHRITVNNTPTLILANAIIFLFYYFAFTGVGWLLSNTGMDWLTGSQSSGKPYRFFIYWSWLDIGKYVLIAACFYAMKFYYDYRQSQLQRIELAVINKDMQLNLLRQQLNPHFYFNTLNNLYGLARINSIKLPAALDQLSNIMHYVLEDCNKPKVLLQQEIRFLESYIALEKLRYEQDTIIEMKVEGEVNGQQIIPMLLIQFVENAFKHGMKEKLEKNWMKVNLQVNKEAIVFNVDNSYYTASSTGGIGITSVQHILNLQYEESYDLKMLHQDNRYSVTLKLNLS